ncbi:MAG: glutaminyl-peptide cyclotransferase [Rhodococcus sp.]|nr:glutaminyl-peptide cyclotransferase [Rhodococcus sp. (in: high G+C Gram-positive bacteria)]
MICRHAVRTLSAAAAALALTSGCSASTDSVSSDGVTELRVEIVQTLPHNPDAFTQGLEIAGDDIYEGTGLVGQSWVEVRDRDTGQPRVRVDLPAPLFGEGITIDDDSLWQLTWQNGIAIERDRHTLEELRTVPIDGEGWGICRLGDRLVTSDGSDTLTFRDRNTFEPTTTLTVTDDNGAVTRLNELECVDDGDNRGIWSNIWQKDTIVRIDPDSGDVTARVDAASLRESLGIDNRTRPDDVLNGIAAIPGSDNFLVTGKRWPTMFEVRFTE